MCCKRLVPDCSGGFKILGKDEYEPRYWTGNYEGYGSFCSLRCAAAYGQLVIDQTYSIWDEARKAKVQDDGGILPKVGNV